MCSEEELQGFSQVLAEVTASLGGLCLGPSVAAAQRQRWQLWALLGGIGFGCSAAIPLLFNHSPVENKVWI